MTERATIAQVVQIGVESTPGTIVAANKQFLSTDIEAGVKLDMQKYRPMGQKFSTIIVPGKEWVEAKISGAGSYTEMTYLLAGILKDPGAPATVDTSARLYTYTPLLSSEDTPKTYSVEQGSATRAQKFGYGLVNELELDFSRDGVDVKGTMLGQVLQDGISLTGSPTAITQKPILPTDIDVFLDTTSGGLGATKLTRVLKGSWKISNRWNPLWTLNSANSSFQAHIEAEPKTEIKLLLEADTAGMANLATARAGTTMFMRLSMVNPTLAGASTQKYTVFIDQAVKVADVGEYSDSDGVYAIEFTFEIVGDATWGNAIIAKVWNQLASL